MRPAASAMAAVAVAALLAAAPARADEAAPVLIPPVVHVGDRARLVVPLPADPTAVRAVVEAGLPRSKDLVVLRAELDDRAGKLRAVVDFMPLAVGLIALPPLEVGSIRVEGLSVTVSSVLEGDLGAAAPSPAEGPLAVPGTALLLYGGAFAAVAAFAAAALLGGKGLPAFARALERRRRGLAARSMRRVIARLEASLDQGDAESFPAAYSILLGELRSYLTYRTGANCMALTPREFPGAFGCSEGRDSAVGPAEAAALGELFRGGDRIRFGGIAADPAELRAACSFARGLVDAIEAASPDAQARPSAKGGAA